MDVKMDSTAAYTSMACLKATMTQRERFTYWNPIEIVCDELDVLFISIGWRHKTENMSKHSVHFFVGVQSLSYNEFLHKIIRALDLKILDSRVLFTFEPTLTK